MLDLHKVLWTGAVQDLSGYGSASRDYVRSLDAAGVDVSVDGVTFETWKPEPLTSKILDRRLYELMYKDRGAPIHIIHLTPDNYSQYAQNGKRRIGYFAWETSKLPRKWVVNLNTIVEEVWVPCEYLAKVCRNSGVTIPIFVLPHAIPVPPLDYKPAINCLVPADKFKFYSIFQWSARKFPEGLIGAFYEEFSVDEPVALVLKTYRRGESKEDKGFVRREISRLKRSTRGIKCPPIYLFDDLMDPDSIMALHHSCDCYVSMARSEGFCIPNFEGMAFGHPVIVPNYSAFPEFIDESRGYLVDVPREIPVKDMQHISLLYTPDMVWGDPSVASCRKRMREVFNDQEAAKQKGAAARLYVSRELSYEKIGGMMKRRLEAFCNH